MEKGNYARDMLLAFVFLSCLLAFAWETFMIVCWSVRRRALFISSKFPAILMQLAEIHLWSFYLKRPAFVVKCFYQ